MKVITNFFELYIKIVFMCFFVGVLSIQPKYQKILD